MLFSYDAVFFLYARGGQISFDFKLFPIFSSFKQNNMLFLLKIFEK